MASSRAITTTSRILLLSVSQVVCHFEDRRDGERVPTVMENLPELQRR